MKDVFLLNLIQSLIFTLCWVFLPYRKFHVAWFQKKVWRRGPYVVFALAFVLSIVPVLYSLQIGYGRAVLVAHLNVGSCLLISLLWRPRWVSLTKRRVLAHIVASYIWPLSFIYLIGEFVRHRRDAAYARSN